VVERRQRPAVAAPQLGRLRRQPVDGPHQRARRHPPEQQRQAENGEPRQDEAVARRIHVAQDVVGCARQVDDAQQAIAPHHGERGENPHTRAAAERGERRRRVVGQPLAQRAGVAALHGLGHLLDMGERQPDLVPATDHHAAVIEHAQAGERSALGTKEQIRDLGADPQQNRARRLDGRHWVGPARACRVGGEIDQRLGRHLRIGRSSRVSGRHAERGHRGAVLAELRGGGHHGPLEHCGQDGRLSDQLRLGLAHQLVLIDPKEDDAAQGQHQHRQRHDHEDGADARAILAPQRGKTAAGAARKGRPKGHVSGPLSGTGRACIPRHGASR
jgi:hypothetical protein